MACLEADPSLTAGALSGSQMGSGEGRQHKLCLRSQPFTILQTKAMGKAVSTTLKCWLSQGG